MVKVSKVGRAACVNLSVPEEKVDLQLGDGKCGESAAQVINKKKKVLLGLSRKGRAGTTSSRRCREKEGRWSEKKNKKKDSRF